MKKPLYFILWFLFSCFYLSAPLNIVAGKDVEGGKTDDENGYKTVVRGKKPKEKEEAPVERVLTKEEIKKIPGTGGDLLKSVQNLPGSARPPAGAGMIVIRGSDPHDSIVMLEGHPLPLIYHFGTFASVINTELIDQIDYVPGNFSVRYGRAIGGMINITPKLKIPDKIHGQADIDLIDAGLFFKIPIKNRAIISGAVRRSYIDFILKEVLPEDAGIGIIAAPRYYDYQLTSSVRVSPGDEIEMIFAGADDKMELLINENTEGDPAMTGTVGLHLCFHVFQFHWKHYFTDKFYYHGSFQLGYQGSGGQVGKYVDFNVDAFLLSHYQILGFPVKDNTEIRMGVDLLGGLMRAKAIAPVMGPNLETLAGAELGEINETKWMSGEAFFVEARLKPLPRLKITGGVRLDYLGLVKDFELHPRIAIRYLVGLRTYLTAGAGVYTIEPELPEIIGDWGNPALLAQRAVHYSVGIERKFPQLWLNVSLQFYWKLVDRVVTPTDDYVERNGEPVPERYNNSGRGRSYGLELMVKFLPGHRFKGWLAYTFSKSQRWERDNPVAYPFGFDQPHVLNLVLQLAAGKGWQIGARFRFSSGNPYKRVIESIFYADNDVYIPVMENRPSRRLPAFHQLDIRVDKKFNFRHWWLAFYLDIINVYYRKNPEGVVYNYDFTQSGYIYGLPIIPQAGIEGGF